MPKRDLRLYIEDILDSIEAVESYITEVEAMLFQRIERHIVQQLENILL